MGSYSDDGYFSLLPPVLPKNAVGGGGFTFRVGFKDFISAPLRQGGVFVRV